MKTREKGLGNQATCSDATIYHGNTKNILTFLLLLHFDIMYICVLFTGCPVILAQSAATKKNFKQVSWATIKGT